jgi:hypothetical protein
VCVACAGSSSAPAAGTSGGVGTSGGIGTSGSVGSSGDVGTSGSSGSSGGDAGACSYPGFTGVVTCDASVDAGPIAGVCALAMPTSGGLTGPLCKPFLVADCGYNSDATGFDNFRWLESSPEGGGKGDTAVLINFSATVPYDQLGSFPATIFITHYPPNDAGELDWKTPAGACTITISGASCSSKTKSRAFSGSGTCTQPAAPMTGTSAAPVTIGDFTFNAM